MAKIYMQEGNHENAYILFLRFLTLFVSIKKSLETIDYNLINITCYLG